MILKKYPAKSVIEGAGVEVNRVFGYYEVNDFDPFLMLDYFNQDNNMETPGFPWHPHKGIETISYILRGSVEHQDSIGNKGVIGPGELQWMTAGRGIMHQEMPVASREGIEGFQFWVNLPKSKKRIQPSYQSMTRGTLKIVKHSTYEVRVISGEYQGLVGPIDKSELGIQMLHVICDEESEIIINRDKGKNGFLFVIRGEGHINEEKLSPMNAYTLDIGGYMIKGKLEFIFAQGFPLNEPVAWRGPIVMNTKEELNQTFHDLSEGTFLDGDQHGNEY